MRDARWQRAQTLGADSRGGAAGGATEGDAAWASLAEPERRLLAKSMAVNAGMIEAMDHHIGRLIAYLEKRSALANTVFVVTPDNGPEPSCNPVSQRGFPLWMRLHDYTQDVARLGEKGTFAFIGPEWATAAASPHSLFKFYASEGGCACRSSCPARVLRHSRASTRTRSSPTWRRRCSISRAAAERRARGRRRSRGGRVSHPSWSASRALHPATSLSAWRSPAMPRSTVATTSSSAICHPSAMASGSSTTSAAIPAKPASWPRSGRREFAALMAEYRAYAERVGALEVPDGYDPMRQLLINRVHDLALRWAPALVAIAIVPVAVIIDEEDDVVVGVGPRPRPCRRPRASCRPARDLARRGRATPLRRVVLDSSARSSATFSGRCAARFALLGRVGAQVESHAFFGLSDTCSFQSPARTAW